MYASRLLLASLHGLICTIGAFYKILSRALSFYSFILELDESQLVLSSLVDLTWQLDCYCYV
jgi:hypothetical protein